VSTVWTAVIAVGAATILLKATGPLLLGPRTLPPRLMGLVSLLAPALLAALVVTQAVGGNRSIVIDARLPGLAAGAVAAFLRAPLLAVIVIAAATTALARALT
jgi:branched-subunit amino acid transport protein